MCKYEVLSFYSGSLSAQLEITTTKAESEQLARQMAEDGVSKYSMNVIHIDAVSVSVISIIAIDSFH